MAECSFSKTLQSREILFSITIILTNRMRKESSRLPRSYRTQEKVLKKQKQRKQIKCDPIERKACHTLFELSSDICEARINPQNDSRNISKYGTSFSPWREKNINPGIYLSACAKQRGKKVSNIGDLSSEIFFDRKRTTRVRKAKQHLRSITEPKQKFLSMPKLQKASTITFQQDDDTQNEGSSCFLENRTYASQQVLHITRTLKQCTNLNSNIRPEKKHEIKGLSKKQYRPTVNHIGNKENILHSISVKPNDAWNSRVKGLKCVKNNRLKRLFGDPYIIQKHPFDRPFFPKNPENIASGHSNPISRILLQKYMLVCEEKRILTDNC